MTTRDHAEMFGLLSSELRLRILIYLKKVHRANVSELCKQMEQTQPLISAHLSKLRARGVVDYERKGKYADYFITNEYVLQLLS